MMILTFNINYYHLIHKFQIFCKGLANNSSSNIKSPKVQLKEMGKSGEFLGRLLDTLLKTGVPLIKNVLKLLARYVLIPVGLGAAVSATNAAIPKKLFDRV